MAREAELERREGQGTRGASTEWRAPGWHAPGWKRSLQLALAVVWLLDGLLQLQPFFFTSGAHGFSGMLAAGAPGNPHWIARTITWNASIVGHHASATNAAFALIQIGLGLGIAWRPTVRPALACSVAWSLAVWWFGEGLGGVFIGDGSPLGGGPGGVLFYALAAMVLWPSSRSEGDASGGLTCVAADSIGPAAANVVWVVVWAGLAALTLGTGRSPQGVHDVITSLIPGEPGWMAAIDRHAASLVAHQGLSVAVGFTVLFGIVACAVFLPTAARRTWLAVTVAVWIVIWVVAQNFGMIFPGSATDPNSGPLVVILVLCYWPLNLRGAKTSPPATPATPASSRIGAVEESRGGVLRPVMPAGTVPAGTVPAGTVPAGTVPAGTEMG